MPVTQFPGCCGAFIMSNLYKGYGETPEQHARRIAADAAPKNFVLAITAPEQQLDETMEKAGFTRISRFQTRYPYEKGRTEGRLTIWGHWKGGDKIELFDEKQFEPRVIKTKPVQFKPSWVRTMQTRRGRYHYVIGERAACGRTVPAGGRAKMPASRAWAEACASCSYITGEGYY